MKREVLSRVLLTVLLGCYALNAALIVFGNDWFARSGLHLMWIALLLFIFPILIGAIGMAHVYVAQKLMWWLVPVLAYSVAPVAFVMTLFLRTKTLVTVQDAAQNTQGFGAGNLVLAIFLFSALAFPLCIGGPIVLGTLAWAKRDWKKLVAILSISFVLITAIFFFSLIHRA